MGGKNVKNTIIEKLMQNVAPHLCFGCGETGTLLCSYCKYDIISEPYVGCILCGTAELKGVCSYHNSTFQQVYVAGYRTGVLKQLTDGMKFHNMRAAAVVAARLLHESLPHFPENTVLVPIPTLRSHIRQRGYDQVDMIVKELAALRKLEIIPVLARTNKATQHLLGKKDRQREARSAFKIDTSLSIDTSKNYLIIDDIITTGSTVLEAARLISTFGVPIFVGAVAYQPLD